MSDSRSSGFKDHFSGHAGSYASHRPDYPAELFAWLAANAPGEELAWDAGTGNGQAAAGLAGHFRRVHATDASVEQIGQATAHPAVRFCVEPAERCSLTDGSADLVTVAQALHWFDFDRFFAEVRRVLRPGGLFAAWTYQLNQVSPGVDKAVRRLYGLVDSFWPPERRLVEGGYTDIPFPFDPIAVPDFPMRTRANLAAFRAYLGTWSAVRRYQAALGEDPRLAVDGQLARAWGEPGEVRDIEWPLVLRAGFRPEGN